ncbi:hypothetical protein PVAP13_2NG633400 [Panicum virgatum]|nr:hypothetical protein PVAP13_2NG633400 [Panicum virgatum]
MYGHGHGHHHHGHQQPPPAPHDQTLFKILCRADEGYCVTVRHGAVVLAPTNPRDEFQHWYKDMRHSTKVKDEEGHPAFALVNKATGLAIKHSLGQSHPVRSLLISCLPASFYYCTSSIIMYVVPSAPSRWRRDFILQVKLVPYNPEYPDESVLWTESKDVGKGFRCIRMVNNIHLNFDAFHGDKDHGGVHDGTTIVLWEWAKGDNQRWKILPWGDEAYAPPQEHPAAYGYPGPGGSQQQGAYPPALEPGYGYGYRPPPGGPGGYAPPHHHHQEPGYGGYRPPPPGYSNLPHALASEATVRVYCKADEGYSLTVRNGTVCLAPTNPRDDLPYWVKDMRRSASIKDEEGYPAFALVNRATGEAIKHSLGQGHPVKLVPYNPEEEDASVLWTESRDVGKGFRCIRMVNNIYLNLDAFHGDKAHGGVHDGTSIVLWEWAKGDNQSWKIVPW